MLETFFNTFGFVGSLIVSLIVFIIAILWISGLAGICSDDFQHAKKNTIIILSVLFPPLPLAWMLYEIVRQNRLLNQLDE